MTDPTPTWMIERSAEMEARRIYDEKNIGELVDGFEVDDISDCDGDACRL